jgi:hypothetical protein
MYKPVDQWVGGGRRLRRLKWYVHAEAILVRVVPDTLPSNLKNPLDEFD